MNQLGNLLGVLTAVLFGFAVMNFVIKWVNRKWIVQLPKESALKKHYLSVMKYLVKNHRYFGFAAVGLMLLHVVLQLVFKWVSLTGIVAAAFAVLALVLGVILFRRKKRTPALLWAHRSAVIALAATFVVHVITRR